MYVCVCKAITERQVHAAVDRGVVSLRELRRKLSLGTGCGKCVREAYTLIRARQQAAPAAETRMRIKRGLVQ